MSISQAREAREREIAHRAAKAREKAQELALARAGIKQIKKEEDIGNGVDIGSVLESYEQIITSHDHTTRRMQSRKVKQSYGISQEWIHYMNNNMKWKRIRLVLRDEDEDDDGEEEDGDTSQPSQDKESMHPLFKRHTGTRPPSTPSTSSNGYHPMELPPPMTSTSMLMKHLSSRQTSLSLLNVDMNIKQEPDDGEETEDDVREGEEDGEGEDEPEQSSLQQSKPPQPPPRHGTDDHDVDEPHHIVYEQPIPISSPALQSSSPTLLSMTSPALISMTSPALHATTLTISNLTSIPQMTSDHDKDPPPPPTKTSKKRYLMDDHDESDGEEGYSGRKRRKREDKRRT